jgi:hypothetical protein
MAEAGSGNLITADDFEDTRSTIEEKLDDLAEYFNEEAVLSLIVRLPGNPDATLIFTQDETLELMRAVQYLAIPHVQ